MPLSRHTCRVFAEAPLYSVHEIYEAPRGGRRSNAVTQSGSKVHRSVKKKLKANRSARDHGWKGNCCKDRGDGTPELSRTRDRATNPEICGSRNRVPATTVPRTQHFRIICLAGRCFVAVENCGRNSGSNLTGVYANSRAPISTLARAKRAPANF